MSARSTFCGGSWYTSYRRVISEVSVGSSFAFGGFAEAGGVGFSLKRAMTVSRPPPYFPNRISI